MSEASGSGEKSAAQKTAERLRKLRDLHAKRVSKYFHQQLQQYLFVYLWVY